MTPTPAPQAICEFCDTTITTAAPCFTKEMASDCSERKKMLRKKKSPQASPEVGDDPVVKLARKLQARGQEPTSGGHADDAEQDAYELDLKNAAIKFIPWILSHASTPPATVTDVAGELADALDWLESHRFDRQWDADHNTFGDQKELYADEAKYCATILRHIKSTAGTQEPEPSHPPHGTDT